MTKNEDHDKEEDDDGFHFRPDPRKVDEEAHRIIRERERQRQREIRGDEFKIDHIADKIRFAKKVRDNPPEKEFLGIKAEEATVDTGDGFPRRGVAMSYNDANDDKKIRFYSGIFNIDLNNDAYWFFTRSCNVFPLILDQGIRTHLDIKKCHEPEKRKIEFPYMLIILAAVAFIIFFLAFYFIVKGFGGGV